jgi:hypothetical protein
MTIHVPQPSSCLAPTHLCNSLNFFVTSSLEDTEIIGSNLFLRSSTVYYKFCIHKKKLLGFVQTEEYKRVPEML